MTRPFAAAAGAPRNSQQTTSAARTEAAGAANWPRHLTSASTSATLSEWMTHDNAELRKEMLEFMKDDLYKPNFYQSLMEFRAQTLERLKLFAQQRFFKTEHYLSATAVDVSLFADPRRFLAGLEVLAYIDYSLAIKAGVHYTLCGGTICKLGTKKHHEKYLHLMDDLTLPGCFGMTELGHGSNVMGIQTEAEYDASRQQFVINTPHDEASKFWIGGAAQHGKVCTVFAQLTVNGTYQGPHVFVVRIRDDAGRVAEGVRIEDNGPKMGLNGVDNGRIWFRNVRVPLDNLLDRYASVKPDGTYESDIPSVSSRFGIMVGGLTNGRMLIAQAAIDSLKIGVAIAIRYALLRPQFGGKPIMGYVTHQLRLLPALADAYGLHLGMGHLKNIAFSGGGDQNLSEVERGKQLHVMSAGLKAAATWVKVDGLQKCRECCGGQGFLAINKIGPMAVDTNVDATFEGDNTVMMQQVAKALVDTGLKAKMQRPGAPTLPGGAHVLGQASDDAAQAVMALLQFRQDSMVAEIVAATQQAVAMASGKKEAAAAAADAFEAHMDLAVNAGWAYVQLLTFRAFWQAIPSAPQHDQGALRSLAMLHGVSSIARAADFYLSSGAVATGGAAQLRTAQLALCGQLMGNGVLWKLCNGFGIPDHCLQAPIAFDWRKIQ